MMICEKLKHKIRNSTWDEWDAINLSTFVERHEDQEKADGFKTVSEHVFLVLAWRRSKCSELVMI
jgi:hypothetical protein